MADVDVDEIESALRRQVKLQAGSENATINSIRSGVEEELDLEAGYIKRVLGSESKAIINEEFEKLENPGDSDQRNASPESDSAESPVKAKPKKAKAPAKKAAAKKATPKKAAPKKAALKKATPKKKKKVVEEEEEEEEEEYEKEDEEKDEEDDLKEEELDEEKPKIEPKKEDEKNDSDDDNDAAQSDSKPQDGGAQSESEMSVLIDEDLPKSRKGSQKRQKTSKDAKGSSKKSSKKAKSDKPANSTKAAESDDPKVAEVKKLQSQLVSCGFRKVWGNYLKPYPTPGEKITHLKSVLKEIGMDGRYSQDKAKKIKKRREMQQELESITQSNIVLTTGRSSRSKAPPLERERPAKRPRVIEESDDDDDDDNDE